MSRNGGTPQAAASPAGSLGWDDFCFKASLLFHVPPYQSKQRHSSQSTPNGLPFPGAFWLDRSHLGRVCVEGDFSLCRRVSVFLEAGNLGVSQAGERCTPPWCRSQARGDPSILAGRPGPDLTCGVDQGRASETESAGGPVRVYVGSTPPS